MASVYMLTLDDGGFSGVVDLLHPDYLKQIRKAVELSINKKTSGSISDKPSSGIFEEMPDAQFVKLMYRVSVMIMGFS